MGSSMFVERWVSYSLCKPKMTSFSGLYYKHFKIINDNSSIIIKFEASLTDNARIVIYDRHMFIVQATGGRLAGSK
jgi:hypothetical protein